MAKKISPTQRVLAHLRKQNFDAIQVVEYWQAFARIRKDLFNFIDIVAIKGGETHGIQATSYSNIGARVKKIQGLATFPIVKAAGWHISVQAPKKDKSGRWTIVERKL